MFNDDFKETQVGFLPKSWEVVTLGDLADYINGYAFKPQQWETVGRPIIRIQNLTGSSDTVNYFSGELDNRYFITSGDLLISWSASLDAYIWQGDEAWLNQHIFKVDNIDGNCDKKFLYFALKHIIESIRGKTRGSTMKHITRKEFLATPVMLPPLSEQLAIAHVLSTVRQAIEATEGVIAAAQELKRSMMKHLFTYGPVPVHEADQEPLIETEIGMVPEDWVEKPLGNIATLQRGNDLPKRERKPGIYPVVGSNGIVDYHSEYIADGIGVFVGRSGSVGEVTRINTAYWPLNTSLWVKDFHGNDRNFVYYLLKHFDFRKYTSGVSVPTLNRNLVHPIMVGLPDLQIQQQIANILDVIEDKIQSETKKIKTIEALFSSLLHHLMTGKVRVLID
jgi:type I restriction enzyme S subunit